jgi:hypothetical protein
MAEAGKGSKPRPFSVSHDEWSQRWDAIFGRDLDNKPDDSNQKEVKENTTENKDVVSN